jgi:hypothetical protein
VEGVEVRVHPLLPLFGRVVVADGLSTFRFEGIGVLLAYPDDTGIAGVNSAMGLVSRSTLRSDGQFTVPASTDGKHVLILEGLPDDAYIKEIVGEQRNIHENGIEIGSSQSPVEVVVDTRGGRISGVAQDRLGSRLSSVRTVLIPKTDRGNLLLYKTAITNSRGEFVIRGVKPGDYKLLAFDEIPDNAWLNSEYLVPFEDRGVALHVDVAQKVTNIRLYTISSSD